MLTLCATYTSYTFLGGGGLQLPQHLAHSVLKLKCSEDADSDGALRVQIMHYLHWRSKKSALRDMGLRSQGEKKGR